MDDTDVPRVFRVHRDVAVVALWPFGAVFRHAREAMIVRKTFYYLLSPFGVEFLFSASHWLRFQLIFWHPLRKKQHETTHMVST